MPPKKKTVGELESEIRDFLNKPRQSWQLRRDIQKFYMAFSCLDAIGDTDAALDAYLNHDFPADVGEQYLLVYGILQVLFVQQDTAEILSRSLGFQCSRSPELQRVRETRNNSVGHPADRKDGSTHFINRSSLSKSGYQLVSTHKDTDKSQFTNVDVIELIAVQRKELVKHLGAVLCKIKEEEMAHRRKFRNKKLEKLFPQALGYYFQKILESCDGGDKFNAGLSHVKLVLKVLEELNKELEVRDILESHQGIKYHFNEVYYPLLELKKYFDSSTRSKLNSKDANIFAYFAQEQVNIIKKLSCEIDQAYGKDL